ncbi:MFS transporter [Halobacillus andaensis]|uniref:MFS transporter n=1 Tax=Halobacillus andaensis TaxID=1176239 RepID=A0A917B9W9_HALAA|nr:OFA family MFS transporter [Halobacillus andaensis]MBP2005497.1 OFA family oxalate/formate antiporter-like MFS transporter [Halobacillus andaensis]GGF31953.1 MFS transporter [Halobacillus andaensis]
MDTNKNRWLIALSAVAMHLSIGSIYAYSVYKNPMSEELGWSGTDVALSFTIAIFFLGLTAAFMGKFVENQGPRKAGLIAAALFSGGMLLTGLMVQLGWLYGFYITYGVIGGIGLGIGYIAPVSTLVKWFPDRRGLATGMAVFGFGAGSLIAGPTAEFLNNALGLHWSFYILGACYLVLMLLGSSYITTPPEGWKPKGYEEDNEKNKNKGDLDQMTRNEAVKTARFWMLWWMMFINISAGIMLISVASPMGQEKAGMSEAAAATMVGVMGLFNGGGRLIWAALSDYISRAYTYIIFFTVQVVLFFSLQFVTSDIVFQVFMYIIVSIYGGGFSNLPAFIGDLFGTKQLSAIHGYLLTSWAAAGVVGPMVVSYIRETTNSYEATFLIFGVLIATALLTAIAMKILIVRYRKKQAEPELSPA